MINKTKGRFSNNRLFSSPKDKHTKGNDAIKGVIGISAGILGSLCGVGGGIVIIPALKQFTKLNMHTIIGTSLVSVTGGSFFASIAYIETGTADIGIATLLGLSAALATKFGVRFNASLTGPSLQKLLAVSMLGSVPFIAMKKTSINKEDKDKVKNALNFSWKFYLGNNFPTIETFPKWLQNHYQYCFVGFFTGFVTALSGVGGGVIMTTYLGIFSPMTQHEAIATSLVAMVPLGMFGGIFHLKAGNVEARTGAIIGATAAAAMYISSKYLAPKVKEDDLRMVFASLLTVSAIKMLRV